MKTMPYRQVILASNEYYHIFNRSLNNFLIFKNKLDAKRFLAGVSYYLNPEPPVKFSTYLKNKNTYDLKFEKPLIKIIAYCIMPSHFHFICQQNQPNGITIYFQKLTNSYSHYFNTKRERRGPLFEGPFKAKRIESEEQLIHLSRYIHLNPVTAYLVEQPEDYHYSSYPAYLKKEKSSFVNPEVILSSFQSIQDYEKFVLARKEYQRELDKIKHLLLD